MRLNWKNLRAMLYPAIWLLGAGCGGVSVTKSISPATFLLPGLMKADPAPQRQDVIPPAENEYARQLVQF